MPFQSKSQRRLFYAKKARGEMDQKTIDEWESDTPPGIPERVKVSELLMKKRIGHLDFQDFPISIERPKGSVRSGKKPDGTPWRTEMQCHYGYIRGTRGTDGDHVDVYIGEDDTADKVYVVDQMKTPEFKEFDEQKCMLGFPDEASARKAYLAHYDDDRFLGGIRSMELEDFRERVMDKTNHGEKVARLLKTAAYLINEDDLIAKRHRPSVLKHALGVGLTSAGLSGGATALAGGPVLHGAAVGGTVGSAVGAAEALSARRQYDKARERVMQKRLAEMNTKEKKAAKEDAVAALTQSPATLAVPIGSPGSFGVQLDKLMKGVQRSYSSDYRPTRQETNPMGTDATDGGVATRSSAGDYSY